MVLTPNDTTRNMIDRIKNIVNLPLVKNTLKLSSSTAFMMFLPLVVTPILSRIYTPEDYGIWGVFSSLYYIVSAFILLSYENTIVKTNDDNEIPDLVGLCLVVLVFILLGLAGVFAVGIFFNIKFFVDFPCFYYLVLVLAFSGLYSICTNLANRQKQYNSMVLTGITNGLTQAGFRIVLGIFPIVAFGLIVGNVMAQIVSTLLLIWLLRKTLPKDLLSNISVKGIKTVAIKYKKFPLFDAPARFIEFAVGNLAIIILAAFWDKETVGCFSMVMQFVLIPISIIGSAMANVYYKEISENSEIEGNYTNVTIKAAKITFSLAFLPIAFLAFGGDYLLVLFLGEKWTVAGPMALCMSVFSVPVILSEPLLPIFRSRDRQEIRFRVNFANFISSLGILLIVAYFTRNIYISLLAYSIAYAISRFVMYFQELRISGVSLKQVSKWFPLALIVCYGAIIIRIIPFVI